MLYKIINKLFSFLGFKLVSSQAGEDIIIEHFLPTKKDGFYIDIGAHDPIKLSNTFLFHNKGWTGINIEPTPSKIWLFNFFRNKDKNLNVGVGPTVSEMNFYIFEKSMFNTFDTNEVRELQKIDVKPIKTITVPVLPLKNILEKYAKNKEIDIMSIDTEGQDMEVLKSNDWDKFRPRFVILETSEYKDGIIIKKPDNVFDKYMNAIGYNMVADTHINTIYEKSY
jgi:FkbM family methyltransferase